MPVPVALDVRFDAVTPAIGTDGQPGRRPEVGRGGRRGGHGRQGAPGAGRPLDGHADGRRRRAHEWRGAHGNRDRSWGPRRWGGPDHVALVLHQHRRGDALRRHPPRHRGRGPPPRLGLGRRPGHLGGRVAPADRTGRRRRDAPGRPPRGGGQEGTDVSATRGRAAGGRHRPGRRDHGQRGVGAVDLRATRPARRTPGTASASTCTSSTTAGGLSSPSSRDGGPTEHRRRIGGRSWAGAARRDGRRAPAPLRRRLPGHQCLRPRCPRPARRARSSCRWTGRGTGDGHGRAMEAALLARRRGRRGAGARASWPLGDAGTASGPAGWWSSGSRGRPSPARSCATTSGPRPVTVLTGQVGSALAAIHAIEPASDRGTAAGRPLGRPAARSSMRWARCGPRSSSACAGWPPTGRRRAGRSRCTAITGWATSWSGRTGSAASSTGSWPTRAIPPRTSGGSARRHGASAVPARSAGSARSTTLLAAYAAAGGEAIDAGAVHWWQVYATVKWATICALQASTHLSGATRSVELAAIGRRVCESEWDLFVLLGTPPPPPRRARRGGRAGAALRPPDRGRARGGRARVPRRSGRARRGRGRASRPAWRATPWRWRTASCDVGPALAEAHATRLAGLGFPDDAALAAALRAGRARRRARIGGAGAGGVGPGSAAGGEPDLPAGGRAG